MVRLAAAADEAEIEDEPDWRTAYVELLRAARRGDEGGVRERLSVLLARMEPHSLLYVPLGRRGDPRQIAEARDLQRTLLRLVQLLPRLGMLLETCDVLEAARAMERKRPPREGAVTEFDRLFVAGTRAIVDRLAQAAAAEPDAANEPAGASEGDGAGVEGVSWRERKLLDVLEHASEPLVTLWLAHSRSLRLGVMERLAEEGQWRRVREFIERYGQDVFTQRLLTPVHVRSILHHGTAAFLEALVEDPGEFEGWTLLADLGERIEREEAVRLLSLVFEAVIENYVEYKDFNATTTQSDRGDLLYTLLDFLRIKAGYERVSWNLRPLVLIHEALERNKFHGAAEYWRRSLSERIGDVADQLQERLEGLVRQYGMRLATVSDRIEERFVRPLEVDCLRLLLGPAAEAAASGEENAAFARLTAMATRFVTQPVGAGLDVPEWLEALEEELDEAPPFGRRPVARKSATPLAPELPLGLEEARRQLLEWGRRRSEGGPAEKGGGEERG
jgi:hypothetical protein